MMIDQPKKRPPGKLVYNRVGEQCLSEKKFLGYRKFLYFRGDQEQGSRIANS
jgi:hypothetical protein